MKKILVLTIALLVTGCSLFSTRQPEEPSLNGWTFVPPTSSDIVIENFVNCIKHKNLDSYLQCFSGNRYSFIPSSDASTTFPSLFDNWRLSDERQFFLSLTTTLGQSNTINMDLLNTDYEIMTADSVTIVSDYSLHAGLPEDNYPAEYSGKLLFTLAPSTDGLWAITRWQDFGLTNQTEPKETFSFLKAYFHN